MADQSSPDDELERDEREENEKPEKREGAQKPPAPAGPGMFHIYKPGQGYWTRMGTGAAILIILALLGQLLYRTLDTYTGLAERWVWAIVVGVGLAAAIVIWRYLNKPAVVDFMVATESEMKKVNWTSRKELFGSTKVVIMFMLLIAACLFAFDLFFGYVFHWIGVLYNPPM